MKKINLLVLLLLAGLFSAQEVNRFFYEMTFKPSKDSANKVEKELTVLDVWKDKSVYRDYMAVSQDSLMKAFMEQAKRTGNMFDQEKFGLKQGKFTYSIVKPYPIKEVAYEDFILEKKFVYKEPVKLDWKIESDKATIENYSTQKATTSFGGRNWVAWFTTDIPFADGPYKFYGLPGLIVKIEDTQNHYQWVLKGNEKLSEEKATPYMDKMMKEFGAGNGIEVTREKFDKAYQAYKQDPFASIKTHFNNPAMKEYKLPDGSYFVDKIKEAEVKLKKFLNENNNPIELK
ncbi:GLPGLI family protein [Riemerella anatipestifer]|uniref:GLPGLI family protein n=1 Tax=Riemerella anatipestifer TaxID=34085 RepID=UPI00069C86DF|nr:GLPGLI family protein [Riemerella anatipestifer]MDY3316146.1 GLPGLI family protein [Riemerella anatipestifer]MDY3537354.1 GLPGLI family protein [Riemerella anatipestifer]